LISLYGLENVGIRILSAVLKKNSYPVTTVFFKTWRNNNIFPPKEKEVEKLISILKEEKPSIIGIGVASPYFKIASCLTKRIKSEIDTTVVWGGSHPTVAPEDCIESADIVCIGEGEYPLLELVRHFSSGSDKLNIRNLWIKTEQGIRKNEIRALIEDLNELPYPDLGDEDKYYIEDSKVLRGDPIKIGSEYRIMASRGCVFDCAYCHNSTLRQIYKGKGVYYRKRSPENVIGELNYVKTQFNRLKKIKFDDDTFIFDDNWIEKFCEDYRAKIHMPFSILLNPNVVDEATLLKLKEAGLTAIQMGIQGSERETVELYKRKASNEKILQFAHVNEKLKFDVVYDVVLDNPLSSKEDKTALFEFLLLLPRPFKLFLYSLTIFPKTRLAEELLDRKLITADDIEGLATKSWRQYRLSMNYPRTKEDIFWVSLIVLISKNFIPKAFIYKLYRSKFLLRHPLPLKIFSQFCNFIKMLAIAFTMFFRRELTLIKLKEYADLNTLLTQ